MTSPLADRLGSINLTLNEEPSASMGEGSHLEVRRCLRHVCSFAWLLLPAPIALCCQEMDPAHALQLLEDSIEECCMQVGRNRCRDEALHQPPCKRLSPSSRQGSHTCLLLRGQRRNRGKRSARCLRLRLTTFSSTALRTLGSPAATSRNTGSRSSSSPSPCLKSRTTRFRFDGCETSLHATANFPREVSGIAVKNPSAPTRNGRTLSSSR